MKRPKRGAAMIRPKRGTAMKRPCMMARSLTSHLQTAPAATAVRRLFYNNSAQTTVEYLIVALATLAIVTGMSVLGGRVQEGLFTEHAADSASHAITANTAGTIGDVLLY